MQYCRIKFKYHITNIKLSSFLISNGVIRYLE